eukprot:scaffold38143_cov252-Amphora_coffeaeformis.AAC.2
MSSAHKMNVSAFLGPKGEIPKLVTKLGPHDVLMGRGAMATDYEGNLRLREIVVTRREDYAESIKRSEKHHIADEIVQIVLDKGGRFLESADNIEGIENLHLPRDSVVWLIVPESSRPVLIKKVKQLLRDAGPRKQRRRTRYAPVESGPVTGQPNTTTMQEAAGPALNITASPATAHSAQTFVHPHLHDTMTHVAGATAHSYPSQSKQALQQQVGMPMRHGSLAPAPAVYVIPQSVQQQLSEAYASSQNFDSKGEGEFDTSKMALPSGLPPQIALIVISA